MCVELKGTACAAGRRDRGVVIVVGRKVLGSAGGEGGDNKRGDRV